MRNKNAILFSPQHTSIAMQSIKLCFLHTIKIPCHSKFHNYIDIMGIFNIYPSCVIVRVFPLHQANDKANLDNELYLTIFPLTCLLTHERCNNYLF